MLLIASPDHVFSNVALGVNYPAMASAQAASEEIQAYRTAIITLKLADKPVYSSGPVGDVP